MRSYSKHLVLIALLALLVTPWVVADDLATPADGTPAAQPADITGTISTAEAVSARTALPFDTQAGFSRLIDDPAPAWAATGAICQYSCPMNMVQLCPQIQGMTVTCESGCCVYC